MVTRQEVQSIVDGARSKIVNQALSRSDVQVVCDQIRERILEAMYSVHQANQQMNKQSQAQRDQLWRKANSFQTRLQVMEQEIRLIRRMVQRMYEQQARVTTTMQQYHAVAQAQQTQVQQLYQQTTSQQQPQPVVAPNPVYQTY